MEKEKILKITSFSVCFKEPLEMSELSSVLPSSKKLKFNLLIKNKQKLI